MKIEKKLWITLFVFGLFAIGFSGWIFSQSTAREKLLWDNTIRLKQKNWQMEKSNQRILLCPKTSMIPDQSYLKPHTPLQKCGWTEKKYTNTEMKKMLPALWSHREAAGTLWIFRKTALVKVLRSELFQYMTTIMEMKSALYTEHEAIAFWKF